MTKWAIILISQNKHGVHYDLSLSVNGLLREEHIWCEMFTLYFDVITMNHISKYILAIHFSLQLSS